MKYSHFIYKDHGDLAVVQEAFYEKIEDYLDLVQRYLKQNKNNKVDLKLKLWRDFYNGDDFVEYMAEDYGLQRRTIYFHIDSVSSILKRLPDAQDMWRKI